MKVYVCPQASFYGDLFVFDLARDKCPYCRKPLDGHQTLDVGSGVETAPSAPGVACAHTPTPEDA